MSEAEWIGRSFIRNVRRCARCAGDHDDVTFLPFTKPNVVGSTGITYTHFAMCPTTNEPILLRFVQKSPEARRD
jgi:hypothetical protein